MEQGIAEVKDFFEPHPIEESLITIVHSKEYVDRLKNLSLDKSEVRKIGFPLSEALVLREFIITQGTLQGALNALEAGASFNIAGGTHHAYPNHGEAFCLFHDQGVAAQYLINEQKSNKILMLDLDVHQGNGTAVMFSHQPKVFTFSMHGKSNYPFRKEQSDWDISLPDGCNDDQYLSTLWHALKILKDKVQPDFVFYLSGVDILESDKLGKLACTTHGCKNRDQMVFEWIHQIGVPVQVSMGGGYSPQIETIVQAHGTTFEVAKKFF